MGEVKNESIKQHLEKANLLNQRVRESILDTENFANAAQQALNHLTEALLDASPLQESVQQALLEMSSAIRVAGLNQAAVSNAIASATQEALGSIRFDLNLHDAVLETLAQNLNCFNGVLESALRTAGSIPADAMVSVEEARAMAEEVRPYLPQEAAERVESEIQNAQTSDHKISGETLKKIFEILVVPLILLLVGGLLTREHDQKEEAFWADMSESRQQEIALREQDIALEKEILEYLKNLPEFPMGVGQDPDGVRNQEQCVHDPVDIQNQPEDQDAVQDFLQEQTDTQN